VRGVTIGEEVSRILEQLLHPGHGHEQHGGSD
jgi:hypothetical protein